VENLQETQHCPQGSESSDNVVVFPQGTPKPRCKKSEPPPSDEELAEYRRIRPILMQIIEQWPHLLKEHRIIAQGCPLAIKLIRAAD
jgi:hypothetical protein